MYILRVSTVGKICQQKYPTLELYIYKIGGNYKQVLCIKFTFLCYSKFLNNVYIFSPSKNI